MIINGETVLFQWGFTARVITPIKWVNTSNGNWRAYDRGPSIDIYESDLTFIGPLSELQDFESALATGRNAINIICGDGEYIFGPDIDYTNPINVTVTKYGSISRASSPSYQLSITLRCLSDLTFIGTPSLADLKIESTNYISNSEYDIHKTFAYDGTAYYSDRANDEGIFKARFLQTDTEARNIRRFLLTSGRTASFPFPVSGITYPFGYRIGSGPFNVRCTEWSDLPKLDLKYWGFDITFRREF